VPFRHSHGGIGLESTHNPFLATLAAASDQSDRVRDDGGFAGNDWLDVLETQRVEYVVGLASNARLDHRAVKRMTRPMLGFKPLWATRCTIAGIEVRHAIRKVQLVDMGGESPTPAKQFYALAA